MKKSGVTERIPPRGEGFNDFFHSQDLPGAIAGIRRRGDHVQPVPVASGAAPIYVVMPGPSTPNNKARADPDTPPFHPQDKQGADLYPSIDAWLTACQQATPGAMKWDRLRAKLDENDLIGLTVDYLTRISKQQFKSEFGFLMAGEMIFLHDQSRLTVSAIREEADQAKE